MTKACPYCQKMCETTQVEDSDADGYKRIRHLHYCPSCNALEIGEGDDTSELTEREIACGWELIAKVSTPDF